MVNTPNKIIVHHTAAEKPDPQFDAINEWHKDRGFPRSKAGYYVGYHAVIEKDGMVKIAREDGEEGAHTIGQNKTSLGIALAGNNSEKKPTKEQMHALGMWISEKVALYKIPITSIQPHRTYSRTSCNGDKLTDNFGALCFLRYEIDRLETLYSAIEKE
jgi:hypothetical protein